MRVIKKNGKLIQEENKFLQQHEEIAQPTPHLSKKPYHQNDHKQSSLLMTHVWNIEVPSSTIISILHQHNKDIDINNLTNKDIKILKRHNIYYIDGVFYKRGDKELEILKREQVKEVRYVHDTLYARYNASLPCSEVESALNVGLYKAFISYNPTIGCPFKTHLYNVSNSEILLELRNYRRFNGVYTTKSGNKRVNLSYDTDNEECIEALNLLTSSLDDTDRISIASECLSLVKEFANNNFTGKSLEILNLIFKDEQGKDIADKVHTTRAYVTNTRKKLAKRFLEEYPEYKSYLKSL